MRQTLFRRLCLKCRLVLQTLLLVAALLPVLSHGTDLIRSQAMLEDPTGSLSIQQVVSSSDFSPLNNMLVDLNLPGERGLSLARRVRAVQPGIGIIMLRHSAHSVTNSKAISAAPTSTWPNRLPTKNSVRLWLLWGGACSPPPGCKPC
jgi:CheY-like chemotaxis protein